jgi:hypothetical protein
MEKPYSAIEDVQKVLSVGKIVKQEVQEALKEKIQTINDFLELHKNASELGEETEKDKIYSESTQIWNHYTEFLKQITYYIPLTGEEYHYIKNLIMKDLHYNEQDVFLALKFKENFLDVVDEFKLNKNDSTIHDIPVLINDITLLHHLMKNESVKGITKKTLLFKSVITQIGQVYKIFNVWNKESEEISTKIYNWTKGLTPFDPEAEKALAEAKVPTEVVQA